MKGKDIDKEKLVKKTKKKKPSFSPSVKVLKEIFERRNLSTLDYRGGINSLARSFRTDFISGISSDPKEISYRIQFYGDNDLGLFLFGEHFFWRVKCRSAINSWMRKQVVEVVRDGETKYIDASQVVVGDIVLLKRGSIVPADGFYIDGDDLELDEGLLYWKSSTPVFNQKTRSGDPFIPSLSQVMRGTGRMVVAAVGSNSSLEKYLKTLQFAVIYKAFSKAEHILQNLQMRPDVPMGREGLMLIHWVARQGSKKQLDLLLRYDVDLNIKTVIDQKTPLHIAVEKNKKLVPWLLGSDDVPLIPRADPNLVDAFGRTPLFTAVRYASDLITVLSNHGANWKAIDFFGQTLLHYACIYQPSLLQTLIDSKNFTSLLDHQDKDGNTVLHYAVIKGNVEAVRVMLESRANLNIQNNAGRTPVHYLCMADLKPRFLYHRRKRILIMNCGKQKIPMLKLKVNSQIRKENLTDNANFDDLHTIFDMLLECAELDVHARDIGGFQPIHYSLMASQFNSNPIILSYLKKLLHLPHDPLDDECMSNVTDHEHYTMYCMKICIERSSSPDDLLTLFVNRTNDELDLTASACYQDSQPHYNQSLFLLLSKREKELKEKEHLLLLKQKKLNELTQENFETVDKVLKKVKRLRQWEDRLKQRERNIQSKERMYEQRYTQWKQELKNLTSQVDGMKDIASLVKQMKHIAHGGMMDHQMDNISLSDTAVTSHEVESPRDPLLPIHTFTESSKPIHTFRESSKPIHTFRESSKPIHTFKEEYILSSGDDDPLELIQNVDYWKYMDIENDYHSDHSNASSATTVDDSVNPDTTVNSDTETIP